MDQKPRLSGIKKWIYLVLTLTAIGSAASVYYASKLELNYDFERFFPEGDQGLEDLRQFRDDFGSDNDLVILAISNREGIFNRDFLQNLESFTNVLDTAPGVKQVNDLLDLKYPVHTVLGLNSFPVVHPNKPEAYKKDSIRCVNTPGIVGSFIGKSEPVTAIYIETVPSPTKETSDSLLQFIDQQSAIYEFDRIGVNGKIKSQQYIIEKMQFELSLFISLSAVLIILFLWVAFRSLWGILIPTFVVIISTVWLVGFIGWKDGKIDLMASLLPSIMFVVGTSDVIHILNKYLHELRLGLPKMAALKIAFKEVAMATLLTSITTALGFITLISAAIEPVQNFGIYAAIGVLLAYLLAFTLLPSLLYLLPLPPTARQTKIEEKWHQFLNGSLRWILDHSKALIASTIVFIGVCFLGISQLETNNFLLEDLQEDDPHLQDFYHFQEQFSGARPLNFVVAVDTGSIMTYQNLEKINLLEHWIDSMFSPGFQFSPLAAVKAMNQAYHRGQPSYFVFPDERTFKRSKKWVDKGVKSGHLDAYLTKDERKARISGQMADIGGKLMGEKLALLSQKIEQSGTFEGMTVTPTGTALLIDKNNSYLVQNMMKSLLIAFAVILVLMTLLFKSIKLAVLSLIPNMLPLLTIAGIMGFSGIDLKVSTSLVFTIAFGIAVDDTLHFVARYQLERRKGKRPLRAVHYTFLTSGKAILLTSFILYAGFLLLILSAFNSTFYIGLLVSTGMLAALIFDLILLPIILVHASKKGSQSA